MMEIVGFFVKSVEARREDAVAPPLNINNRINLVDVKEVKVEGIKRKLLRCEYEYTTEYMQGKKKVAEIKLKGHVLLMADNIDKLLKEWEKNKRLNDNVNAFILNHVLRKCVTRAMSIAEDLSIPSPIPLPFIRVKSERREEETSKYIG